MGKSCVEEQPMREQSMVSVAMNKRWRMIAKHWQFYVIIALPITYFILFKYVPMYGILLAFKKYRVTRGIWGSPWVGLNNFSKFFANPSSWQIIWNTFSLSMYALLASIPLAVLLAICLNEVNKRMWKKTVQMVTYAPYFISTVVLVAILMQFMDPALGLFNTIRTLFGREPMNFMGKPELFRHIYVWSAIWQNTGYNAIIYLAALSSVNVEMYEAGKVDGVNKFQKVWYIDLPTIKPTIVIMLILNMGYVMSVGFEKAFLMQNPLNLETAEIMSTYVYKIGLVNNDFSYSTAIGLLNSCINVVLILTFNWLAKRKGESSLW
jgi:putative aldouronate transport system permease protein